MPRKQLKARPARPTIDGKPAQAPAEAWRNRIVGHDEVDAITLKANEKNWRIHPKSQRSAMNGVLGDVGWVQSVLVNKLSGRVVDGHLRVDMAAQSGQKVPVVYVELTEAEEAKILASLDPLSSMAVTDSAALAALVDQIPEGGNKALDSLLHSMVDQEEMAGLDDVPSDPVTRQRLLAGEKLAQIKAVMYCDQIAVFEAALKATGEFNRGEALMKICKAYLEQEEKGQLNISPEAQPAEAGAARA